MAVPRRRDLSLIDIRPNKSISPPREINNTADKGNLVVSNSPQMRRRGSLQEEAQMNLLLRVPRTVAACGVKCADILTRSRTKEMEERTPFLPFVDVLVCLGK